MQEFLTFKRVLGTLKSPIIKISIVMFLCLLKLTACSQKADFGKLMESGKAEFKKEFEDQDFNLAVDYLEKAVELKPNDPEAHYFLGYAYSRLNSKDGEAMLGMTLPILLKSSLHFEKVIALSPKYTGEMLILDPYSKITSEWGSMAMKYLNNNQADSAKWAFSEGKKRGGFSAFSIQLAKITLDACAKDAILLSNGDGWTFPLWYAQYLENYRTDVAIVDVGLINSLWYPKFLSTHQVVDFGLSKAALDTLKEMMWKEKEVKIANVKDNSVFSWKVLPGYGGYLYRGDLLLLELLKKNGFKRNLYFTRLFDENARISLTNKIDEGVLVDKLNTNPKENATAKTFKAELLSLMTLAKLVNFNNPNEVVIFGSVRYPIYLEAKKYIEAKNLTGAKDILQIMSDFLPYDKFPTSSDFETELDRILKLTN